MKNPIKTYSFWIKIIGAALLIAFSVWLLVDESMAVFIVLMLTGLVACIFAIIRIIPLIRTLKTGRAKLTCLGEIIIHILVGVLLVLGAFSIVTSEKDNMSWYAKFMQENYRFFIAFFFETRVISYFMCVVLFKEETDKTKFWVHIVLLVLGCVMCSLANLNAHIIAIVIAVIALLCSTVLIIDGGLGYNRYRKSIVKEREKQKEEPKENEVEAPGQSDDSIPVTDEIPTQNQDSLII